MRAAINHNQNSTKKWKKTALKRRMWTKNFAHLQNFFPTPQFSLSRKQRYEQKTTLFAPLFILFSNKITPIFFAC